MPETKKTTTLKKTTTRKPVAKKKTTTKKATQEPARAAAPKMPGQTPRKVSEFFVGDVVTLESAKQARGVVRSADKSVVKVKFDGKSRVTSHAIDYLLLVQRTEDEQPKKAKARKTNGSKPRKGAEGPFGQPKSAVVRWMGAQGFTRQQAIKAFDGLGFQLSSCSSLLKQGKKKEGVLAELTKTQEKEILKHAGA